MTTSRTVLGAVAAGLLLAAAPPAEAQLNRTAVSVNGSDVNNCAPATPCRTIGRALTQTSAGGEVVVLDSAGYGPFTVTQAVTVQTAPGAYAGVTATAGDAVTVNLPASSSAKVVLRGLTLNGVGTGSAGIAFVGGDAGTELHVENCVINGFANWGILSFLPMRVQDTTVRNSRVGIQIDNAGGPVNATIERVQLKNNTLRGVLAWRNANVTVRDTVAAFHSDAAFWATVNGVLNIENSIATENLIGVSAAGTGTVRLSNTMVVNNTTGLQVGTGVIATWQNNKVRGNTTDVSGTLTPIAQQ